MGVNDAAVGKYTYSVYTRLCRWVAKSALGQRGQMSLLINSRVDKGFGKHGKKHTEYNN